MESKWAKAKRALGLNLCTHAPRTLDDASPSGNLSDGSPVAVASSPAAAAAAAAAAETTAHSTQPTEAESTPLSKLVSRSFKKTCAICLGSMRLGHGHALFTAECSHTFHFNCITSNVKHGNHICPVCRAKWTEIPFTVPSPSEHPHGRMRVSPVDWPNDPHGRTRVSPVDWPNDDAVMTILRRRTRPDHSDSYLLDRIYVSTLEPGVFDDDEPLELPGETAPGSSQGCGETVEIKTYPEFPAVEQSASEEDFAVLIHLKAPVSSRGQTPAASPIDLVTVLDVSGSMSGTKLALLKRAMGFVIQNLGPADRLSVVTFSTYAHRLFHLRRMSESGRQQALQAVDSLTCHGGTNISDGLQKAAKVVGERREKNPVSSIILLSDGQDTHPSTPGQPDYRSSMPANSIPVHAFGFGDDHDPVTMHTISEVSGGTFSYIEAEGAIQDAFAQCIGGLLSVVAQGLDVQVETVHPGVRLRAIKSGSYASEMSDDRSSGSIHAGDMYAEEERDFLVSVTVPSAHGEMSLLRVGCAYLDPASNETVQLGLAEAKIQRPVSVTERTSSIEVDRQRNRLQAAEAMAGARAAAERGALHEAAAILEDRRRLLSESRAGRAGDQLCMSLDAELREVQERMASQHQYDVSGRAYVLSGLSSHLWQRATARGDSTDSGSLVQSYQTPSMVDMLQRSQTLASPPVRQSQSQPIRPARSFNLRPQPG